MTASGQEQPYARCLEEGCGLEFVDREAASAHSVATIGPPTKRDSTIVVAAGHRFQVVNPTPEERQVLKVRFAIERALDDFYTTLDRYVQRGEFTEQAVKEQMAYYDLGDGWDEYVAEGDT